MKKKILAIVPARGGSKGIKYKNLKNINGKPLIFYTIQTLLKVKNIDKVVLSSEDEKIKKTVKKYFPKVQILHRNKKLASDSATLTEVVKKVSKELYNKGYKSDYVLQVAPTCPFITTETIKKIIKKLIKKRINCVVTLKRIEHEHPYRAKILNKKNFIFKSYIKNINVEKYMSRQDLPEMYCTSGGIYARDYKLLQTFNPKKKNFCLGKNPVGIVLTDKESVNIDRPIDLEFAKFLSKKKI
tara:strand:- start:10 stop:735 length:726 start_codon:yes stop_codon:yes gene_type:complete